MGLPASRPCPKCAGSSCATQVTQAGPSSPPARAQEVSSLVKMGLQIKYVVLT